MKPFSSISILCLLVASAHAEGVKSDLSTDDQKFSYGAGVQIGQSLVHQGVIIDPDAFALGVGDAMKGQPLRLPAEEIKRVVTAHDQKMMEEAKARAEKNQKAGDDYRAANKKKPGVKELESGLQYRAIKDGAGASPTLQDQVTVNYTGRHIDGTVFDASDRHGGAVKFPLANIVKGWQQALQLMKPGAKWEVVVPPQLAYGAQGAPQGGIGPNETLVFEIELLTVEPAQSPAAPKSNSSGK
ncbi:MAG TPA: FKBP-type peptidyl-prolyl cis-trans isomerase [Gammaproteobacteria bacterium]|nr:FKBP-type peptidyl-prolyl cis-trans isomerase [Gammaproteobacteria bacterium]